METKERATKGFYNAINLSVQKMSVFSVLAVYGSVVCASAFLAISS